MDVLNKCQSLYKELNEICQELDYLHHKLIRNDITDLDREKTYEHEFKLIVLLSGCYEDLSHYLDILQEDENMRFMATRMKTNAEAVVLTKGFYVADSI